MVLLAVAEKAAVRKGLEQSEAWTAGQWVALTVDLLARGATAPVVRMGCADLD